MHARNRTEVLRRGLITGAVAALLVTTAACGSEGDDVDLADETSPSPTPTATATDTADPSPTATSTPTSGGSGADGEPAFEGTTDEVVLEGGSGEIAVLEEVRVASRDGYDRVVWEFASGSGPTVRAVYDDEPLEPGRGEPIDVAGPTSVVVSSEPAVDLSAEMRVPGQEAYDGPERIDGGGTEVVTEVVRMGDFEANMQWAVGVDGRQPYRVDVLQDPLRVVLDVRH